MSTIVTVITQNPIYGGNVYNASTNPLGYIPHWEMVAGDGGRSPSEGVGLDGPTTATRTLKCRWQDRWTLFRQLLGGPLLPGCGYGNPTVAQINAKYSLSLSGSNQNIVVFPPHQHPYFPSLFCKSVRMTPETGNGTKGGAASPWIVSIPSETIVNFEFAILTVEYASPQINPAGGLGSFFTEQISPNTEFLTMANNALYWDTEASVPIDAAEAPATQIKKVQWSVIRRKIPWNGLILPLVGSLQGKVNTDTVTSLLGLTSYAPGSLLFEGATIGTDCLSDGNPAVQLELHFRGLLLPYSQGGGITPGWNTFPHVHGTAAGAGNGVTFDPIYNAAGTQVTPYPTAALGSLISASFW